MEGGTHRESENPVTVIDIHQWAAAHTRPQPLGLPPAPPITCIAAPGVWNPCGAYTGEHHQTAAALGMCCMEVPTA